MEEARLKVKSSPQARYSVLGPATPKASDEGGRQTPTTLTLSKFTGAQELSFTLNLVVFRNVFNITQENTVNK